MEIKINREVRNYKESIFFGMSLRQFVCVVISCVFAVMMYFMFRNRLGLEITSWLCIVAALPFILVGFVKYNDMLLDKAFNSNGMVKELYLTITAYKKDYEEAKNYFKRIGTELNSYFLKLGSKCTNIEANEKLRILHNIYRLGEESLYNFDIVGARKLGHSVKDYICPNSFSFKDDYFEMGDKFGRVLFLKDYANFIRDSMVSDLTDINQNMMISIDIKPIPINEAIKLLERILYQFINLSAQLLCTSFFKIQTKICIRN